MIDSNKVQDKRSEISTPRRESNGGAEKHAWETDKPANAERTGGRPKMDPVSTGRKG